MTLREFDGRRPELRRDAWVDDSAVVIGDVVLGTDASVWPHCVIRGDIQRIRIGARTNIQDGTVIHVTHDSRFCPGGSGTTIGDDVTIGHRAVLHGCTVESRALIGMNATIMDGAIVGCNVMIGAGSLVPPGSILESGWLYFGSPARRQRPLNKVELEFLHYSAENYVRLKNRHHAGSA